MDDKSDADSGPKLYRKLNSVKYDSERNVKQALVNATIFISFLIVTTILTLGVHHKYLYFYNNAIERLFVSRPIYTKHGIMYYNNLATMAEWFQFFDKNLLQYICKSDKEDDDDDDGDDDNGTNKTSVEEDARSMKTASRSNIHVFKKRKILRKWRADVFLPEQRFFFEENLIIAPARLRQIRVQAHSCYIQSVFNRYFDNCYDVYSPGIELKSAEYKGTKFYTLGELQTMPFWGKTTLYFGGGYVKSLSYDRNSSRAIVEELKEQKWCDRGTRLLILEFVLYNANTNLYNNIKFTAEHLPTGGIIPNWRAQAVMPYGIWTFHRSGIVVAAVLFYIFVIFYTVIEIIELRQTNWRTYFKQIWNYIDWSILLLAYLAFVLSIVHSILMSRFLHNLENDPNTYHSLDVVCFCYMIYICSMSLCTFLVWTKIFRYFTFNRIVSQFLITLKQCSVDILGFALMFFIVCVAFSLLGVLLFGSSNSDFKNFGSAILTMMRMILGDFNYQRIESNHAIVGPIYFIAYILLVYLILLNIFLAIINETYIAVRNETTDQRSMLKPVLLNLLKKVAFIFKKCRKTSKPESKQNEPKPYNYDTTTDQEYLSAQASKASVSTPVKMTADEAIHQFFGDQVPLKSDHTLIEEVGRLNDRVNVLEGALENLINHTDQITKQLMAQRKSDQK